MALFNFKGDYTHLIPAQLHPVFNQLEGELRDLLVFNLLPSLDRNSRDIAIFSLKIIQKSAQLDPVSQKLRKRFFVCFVKNMKSELKSTLEKVLSVAEEGFFKELLEKVDSKKTLYYPSSDVIRIVNEFCTQSLPLLKRQRDEKKNLTAAQAVKIDSLLLQAYQSLMACSNYYGLRKCVDEFLNLLPQHQKWKEETYTYFFDLVDVQHSLKFDDFEKRELLKAIFRLHSPTRSSIEHCSEIEMAEFIEACSQLKYHGGEELLGYYLKSLSKNEESNIEEMIRVASLLRSQLDISTFFNLVQEWKNHEFDWNYLTIQLEAHLAQAGLSEDHFQEDINARLQRFKQDSTVQHPLSEQELDLIRDQYNVVNQFCRDYNHLNFTQLMNLAHKIRLTAKKKPILEEDRLLLIALARLAIHLHFGIYPYSTQILALLGIFAKGNSRQAQIKTGEGKSTIVALWAFVIAMECRAVDIITSARYLAIRDHDKYAQFFKRCGITTGHICYDRKKPSLFQCQVLYGPAFDFEFAWMQDLLWGAKLYQQRLSSPYVSRNFDAVCVDESDNLLIDAAKNGARLGVPSETSYDWVYPPILSFVVQNRALIENTPSQALIALRQHLMTTLPQHQKACQNFADEQFRTWLQSAYHAAFELNADVDYVVRSQRDEEGNMNRTIQIVDLKTGRISENSRWQSGIHEFLEVKHDIVVQRESLTPITLSHSVFYDFYKTISALTGTAERRQTKDIYNIESFDVPPHRPLLRTDLPTIFADNDDLFYALIIQKTQESIIAGCPILFICSTIRDTQNIGQHMQTAQIPFKLLNEVQDEPEHVILAQAGIPGRVTIATATAGRGTDIILKLESIQNGGLRVYPTCWFRSKREEDQSIGRAGRQGQPGLSQIILNKSDPQIQKIVGPKISELTDDTILASLIKWRDEQEIEQANMHTVFAGFERFLAKKTHSFFESFRLWADYIDQDVIIENFAQKLVPIKLKANQVFSFGNLSPSDLLIAEECLRLLTQKSEQVAWKVLLQKVAERVKQKVIHAWVKRFFEPAENKLKNYASLIVKLKEHENQLFEALNDIDEQNAAGYMDLAGYALNYTDRMETFRSQVLAEMNNINQLFETHRIELQKYLAQNGSGIFMYLKEITSIDLLPVLKF